MLMIIAVLVAEATITRYHRLDGLNNKHWFLTVLEARKSKTKVPIDSVSSENSLLGSYYSSLLPVSSHDWRALWGLFYKDTTPIHENSTLREFQKALHPSTITLKVMNFNIWTLGEHKYSIYNNTLCNSQVSSTSIWQVPDWNLSRWLRR